MYLFELVDINILLKMVKVKEVQQQNQSKL